MIPSSLLPTLFAAAALFGAIAEAATLSPQKSLVWGGGVNRWVVTPAKYFYIQAVDTDGKNFTTSLGSDAFVVSVKATDFGGSVRGLNAKLSDRGDGTYQVQYIVNFPPKSLTIDVRTPPAKGYDAVGGGPFVLDGNLSAESCVCPRKNKPGFIQEFEQSYGCDVSDPANQIDASLEPFRKDGISQALIDEAIAHMNKNTTCFIHYVIKDNKVYTRGYGPMQVSLPDTEFLLNLGDWPQADKMIGGKAITPYPVLAWVGSEHHYDIPLPTYKMTEAGVFGKDLENVQEIDANSFKVGGPWEKKVRTDIAQLSKKHPDLLDVQVSKNQFNYFPDDNARKEHREYEAKYGAKAERVTFESFFKYKYILNVDGTVAAYRTPALIAGNSVIFLQESDYFEHFYKALKPYVHYIPLNRDLSDAVEKYSKLLNYPITVRPQMELVDHKQKSNCVCPKYKSVSQKKKRDAAAAGSKSDAADEGAETNQMLVYGGGAVAVLVLTFVAWKIMSGGKAAPGAKAAANGNSSVAKKIAMSQSKKNK